MKDYEVIAIGELLIDMTTNGITKAGNKLFEANPGGAPCNVLAIPLVDVSCITFLKRDWKVSQKPN